MQYLLKFKTKIVYFIELNWPRIILNWIFYWIELAQNNFELNILFNWILAFFSDWIIFLNWILIIFFWIENWIESFSTVFFWIKNWIGSFLREIQSLIESSNCTSQGYSAVNGYDPTVSIPLFLSSLRWKFPLGSFPGRLDGCRSWTWWAGMESNWRAQVILLSKFLLSLYIHYHLYTFTIIFIHLNL